MMVCSIRVQNFRSIRDETLACENLTALVGRNGAGKSAFLNALNLFYSTSDDVTEQDFYNCRTDDDIVLTVKFQQLSDEARDLFGDRVEEDGSLTVAKVISWNEGKPKATYHGTTLQNPDFADVRAGFEIKDRGTTAKKALSELHEEEQYDDLPEWSTIGGTKQALVDWEKQHPESCVRMRDDGQFFGFRQVGEGYLGRFTRCLFIPAVRDATSDAAEGRGSVLTILMDLVVRSALAGKKELQELQEEMRKRYREMMAPESLPELGGLATELSMTLKTFVPSTEVRLNWLPLDSLEFPTPQADTRLVEDGYASPVGRCGHGLQRAFVVTMLQHLALARLRTSKGSDEDGSAEERESIQLPSLLLLIEEPELYQHPNRQRHFARTLQDLAQGDTPGVADRTQIVYSTHSPHFVGIDRINQIRLLRKKEIADGLPKETVVVQTTLDKIAEKIWKAAGSPGEAFTGETLLPRLTTIMTPWMSEGFFADVAVLVEGASDRAAILGMAQVMGHDLESRGISVIPCGGKTNLDRPTAIFQELGIPTYVVWDGDKGDEQASPQHNHHLLRLLGQEVEDWPSAIEPGYTCFERDLERAILQDMGEDLYADKLMECQQRFAIPKKENALKNPNVVAELIRSAEEEEGQTCTRLREIVKRVVSLCGS